MQVAKIFFFILRGTHTILCGSRARCVTRSYAEPQVRLPEKPYRLRRHRRASGRVLLELLDVALFDFAHQFAAMEKITPQMRGNFARHDKKLIVDHRGPGDRSARGNQVRAPLKHERGVPEKEASENCRNSGERGALRAKKRGETVQKNAQTKDEQRRKRNEEPAPKRGYARPICVAGNQDVEGKETCEHRSARARLAPTEPNQSDDGKEQDRSPSKKSVLGGEQDAEEKGRAPRPN